MTAGGSIAARFLPPLLFLLIATGAGSVAAGSPLPQTLDDVRTGRETELRPGPKVLHIVLFATWCPACVEELDRLADLEERWGNRGYRLVIVAVENRHTPDRLLNFAEQRRPPGTLLFDASGRLQRALEVKNLPAHVLLDSSGEEIARSEILDDDLERTLASVLDPGRGGP